MTWHRVSQNYSPGWQRSKPARQPNENVEAAVATQQGSRFTDPKTSIQEYKALEKGHASGRAQAVRGFAPPTNDDILSRLFRTQRLIRPPVATAEQQASEVATYFYKKPESRYDEFMLRVAQRDPSLPDDRELIAAVAADRAALARVTVFLNDLQNKDDNFVQMLRMKFQAALSLGASVPLAAADDLRAASSKPYERPVKQAKTPYSAPRTTTAPVESRRRPYHIPNGEVTYLEKKTRNEL